MKIACLQFAPQVGDVDNNLNRADAVLNKANQSELEDLDLLVLPELAFSGYNFKSLQDISPFLEPTGSGISALWARTTALKFNCNVALGYPEKVDVTPEWPASPEYYNLCLIVNGDGETIANYRKSFLYYIDEKWALEGRDGFYDDYIPGLGSTAMGICSDLNPYKLEAPWLAFEFAFHVLHVAADLVILSMAWPTDEDQRMYSRMPQEPDMDTITYWVQRLEPLIRAEQDDEIIVVFCNRTGTEEDLTYAGTSAVVGIKSGEVSVYGLLGRGVKEVLVVDTDLPAFAKLVQRTDPYPQVEPTSNPSLLLPSRPPAPPPPESLPEVRKGHTPKLSAAAVERQRSKPATASTTATSLPSQSSRNESPKPQSVKEPAKKLPIPQKSEKPPHISTEKRTEMPPAVDTTNIQSPTGTGRRKEKPMSPTIIIPDSAFRSKPPATDSSRDDSPMVETPTAPSPTPAHMRPKLYLPQTEEEFNKNYRQALTPFPGTGPDPRSEEKLRAKPYIYDGSVTVTTDLLTPRTPYLEFFRDSSPQESKFYWVPSQQMMETPVETRLPQNATSGNSRLKSSMAASSTGHMPRRPFRSPGSGTQTPQEISEKPAKVRVPTPAEVQPPETVLGSRAGARSRGPPTDPQTSAAAPTEASVASPERLRHVGKRSGSRAENISSPVVERGRAHFDFSSSPFTHSSRGRDTNPRSPILDRQKSTSRASIPIAASPSLFSGGFRPEEQGEQQLNDEKQMSQIKGPDPEPLPRSVQRGQDSPKGAARDANRPSSSRQDRRDRTAAKERNISRPTSRRGHHDPVEERDFQSKLRSRSLGGGEFAVRRVRAADIAAKNSPMYGGNIARPQTSIGHRRDEPPKLSPTYNPKLSPTALSDPSDRTTLQSQRGRPVIDRGSSYGPERRAGSKTSRMSPENPFTGEGDDEIIATISRINDGCPVHTTNGGPPAAVVKSEDGTLYAVEFAKGAESLAESIIPTHQKNVLTRFGIEGLSRRQSAVW